MTPPTSAQGDRRSTVLAYLALAGAALLFGATFVVVKDAIEVLPPLAFTGWRFLLGAALLLAVARPRGRATWRDGSIAGVVLFIGFVLQTEGLARTSASNSGFVTGLYVIFTPLIAAAVARRRPGGVVLGGAVVAFLGLALLTVGEGFTLRAGDVLTAGCAVAFAAHVVILSRSAPRHAVVPFAGVQLLVVAVLALLASGAVEGLPLPPVSVLGALALTGLLVSAGAFLLQVWAQKVVGPARTALVLALEPAVAAAFAAMLLGERLTARGWLGAGLILAAIYTALALSDPAADK